MSTSLLTRTGFARIDPRELVQNALRTFGVPLAAIVFFLWLWSVSAAQVQTSLGALPGPGAVFVQAQSLLKDHFAERDKRTSFYVRQEARLKERQTGDPKADMTMPKWTGKATYVDQIFTSLYTVFTGFVLATLVAVPLGILCGSSRTIQTALNPIIQTFRPVSPLAWLPIVTLVVSALYVTGAGEPMFDKSFIISAATVTLCSLWPTLINTAVGVQSVDKDLINVARVLQLPWSTRVRRIIVPSALPYIFTGMRLSLGVGWMVLIAAEMLAQNPGLGKFVWDEFQNGSSESLGRIMVAVLTIGLIGFLLDRIMQSLQQMTERH